MFKTIQSSHEYSDATASFDVILDKKYTVEQFVQAVLRKRRKEFGTIEINTSESRAPYLRYRYGKIESNAIEKFYNKTINHATAIGGYSYMAYDLTLDESS